MLLTRLDLFTQLPRHARCAEIGVMAGDFMAQIITARPDLLYTGVDSWSGSFEKYHSEAYRKAMGAQNVQLIRAESTDAAAKHPDNFFDLVYIDAHHTYDSVTRDLNAWYSKVKVGGILAGHDYETKPAQGGWEPIEVEQAVNDWTKRKGHSINVISETCPSWWMKRA